MKVFNFKTFASVLFCLCLLGGAVRADFNATNFTNSFNSMNSGQGFKYNYTTVGSELELSNTSGYTQADFSAYTGYNTGGSNYMRTFCIEPNVTTIAYNGYAKVNYQNGQSKTSSGATINLGTAALYSQFAAGTLQNFNYTNSATRNSDYVALKTAIHVTMELSGYSSYNWSGNKFLNQLLTINSDKSYWTGAYDPNNYYAEVGDYAVFALNVYSANGTGTQDFIYVTNATYGGGGDGGVPEPATILFWSLGTLGFAGASWRKKQLCKCRN